MDDHPPIRQGHGAQQLCLFYQGYVEIICAHCSLVAAIAVAWSLAVMFARLYALISTEPDQFLPMPNKAKLPAQLHGYFFNAKCK